MPERYRRSEDALADLIRENRRGTRDAQRATGTEKAQTALVAEAALEAADAASETADGKSTVVRSTSPATGAGSYKQGDQWWQFSGANIVGLWLHSGAGWVAQELTNAIIATLDAGKITTGILAADRIGANSITAAKLSATAIDGMTITGALIRTAATGQRLQLDINGLTAYNASNSVVARLSSSDLGMRVVGGVIENYGSETGDPGVVRLDARNTGRPQINLFGNGPAYGSLSTSLAYTGEPDGGVSLRAVAGTLNLTAARTVYLNGGIRTQIAGPELLVATATTRFTNEVSFQGPVSFQGDTDWVPLTNFGTGWSSVAQDGYPALSARRRNGVVELRGVVQKATWAAFETIVTLPTNLRPIHNTDGVCRYGYAAAVAASQVFSNGQVRITVAGSALVILAGVWMLG